MLYSFSSMRRFGFLVKDFGPPPFAVRACYERREIGGRRSPLVSCSAELCSTAGEHSSPLQCARLLLQGLVLFLLLTGGLDPGISAQVSPAQVPQQERALRTRVKEFYNFLQAGNWSKAEDYITRETLDTFRNQTKTPFQGFEIDSIKLQPDGKSAAVVIRVNVMTPYSPTPFPLRRPSHWRLIAGVWQVDASESPTNKFQAEFEPPAMMGMGTGMGQGAMQRTSPPAPDLKFENRETIVEPIHPGEVKEARFPFKNVSDHVVRIAEVKMGGSSRLRLEGEKKEYKPGESGTLVFDWDPIHYDYPYGLSDTVIIKTDPGGKETFVTARTFVTALPAGEAKSPNERPK